MTFFRRRGPKTKRKISPGEDTLPYRSSLAKFEGDLTAFRANDVAMKVWLPEAVDEILKQLSDHWPSSRSEMIRDTLFVYAYGQYAFAQMKAQNDGFFYIDPDRFCSRGREGRYLHSARASRATRYGCRLSCVTISRRWPRKAAWPCRTMCVRF